MIQEPVILVINSGSSSIKFAVYKAGESIAKTHSGKIENIGTDHVSLSVTEILLNKKTNDVIGTSDFDQSADRLISYFQKNIAGDRLQAIGHRIVHGMRITQPSVVDENLLLQLKKISSFDPDHLPAEIEIISKLKQVYPKTLQVACFDTSFHASMPTVAKIFPLPRKFTNEGVQRYGFHGLSYSYIMEVLETREGKSLANGKVIIAHLGSGASLAAIKDGKCLDTTMGFTPTGGIMMGTRTGDLDPGVAWYMMEIKKMDASKFNHLVNHESGLLGVSETTSDMQELLRRKETDTRAVEAIDLFCYQVKKCIGSFIAVLGGLDALVFTGGIGENASPVRSSICNGLNYAGIKIDEEKNKTHAFDISANGQVKVLVIQTDEELVIARDTNRVQQQLKKITV